MPDRTVLSVVITLLFHYLNRNNFWKTFLPFLPIYRLNYKQIEVSIKSNLYSTLNKLVYIQKRFLEYVSFRTENLHISFFLKNKEAMGSIPTMYCSNRLPQSTHNLLNTEAVVLVFSKIKQKNREKFLLSCNCDTTVTLRDKVSVR